MPTIQEPNIDDDDGVGDGEVVDNKGNEPTTNDETGRARVGGSRCSGPVAAFPKHLLNKTKVRVLFYCVLLLYTNCDLVRSQRAVV